jgi:alcohol dehydrogenase (NADP+)
LKRAVRSALDAGYRYFDTAAAYGNESAIGDVLQEYYDAGKLKREDVWITTKLPFFAHRPEDAEKVLKESLKNLHTDYLDLYLLHTPLPFKVICREPAATPPAGAFHSQHFSQFLIIHRTANNHASIYNVQ